MEIVDVVCAIIVKNNMILATDKDDSESNAGFWVFPGGKVSEHETYEECLKRHVMSKVGLNISLVEKLPTSTVEIESKGKTYRMHPYIAEIVNDEVILETRARSEWFMPIQLMRLAWPHTDLPIVEEIVDRIIRTGSITRQSKQVAV